MDSLSNLTNLIGWKTQSEYSAYAQELGAARSLDSWRRPEGSRPMGTRIPLAQKQTYLLFLLFQFISHPVVYNLLDKRWIGQFYAWKSFFWIWILLWLWCFLDVILFPFILAIFFVRDKAKLWIRKYQGLKHFFVTAVSLI